MYLRNHYRHILCENIAFCVADEQHCNDNDQNIHENYCFKLLLIQQVLQSASARCTDFALVNGDYNENLLKTTTPFSFDIICSNLEFNKSNFISN